MSIKLFKQLIKLTIISKMTNSAEEYLEKKVRGLIEPMVSSLLMERPKEPVRIK